MDVVDTLAIGIDDRHTGGVSRRILSTWGSNKAGQKTQEASCCGNVATKQKGESKDRNFHVGVKQWGLQLPTDERKNSLVFWLIPKAAKIRQHFFGHLYPLIVSSPSLFRGQHHGSPY